MAHAILVIALAGAAVIYTWLSIRAIRHTDGREVSRFQARKPSTPSLPKPSSPSPA